MDELMAKGLMEPNRKKQFKNENAEESQGAASAKYNRTNSVIKQMERICEDANEKKREDIINRIE